ncbi:MAG: EF-hand domain-containing protein, partial [Deltaproteobacteria bacterium]
VNPSGAILTAGEKNSFTFRAEEFNMPYLGVLTVDNTKVIETVIPIGRPLYVMGFAKRLTLSADEKKKGFLSRLMALKSNPSALKKYDANGDGRISAEEWDDARRSVEEEQTTEATEAVPKDDIAVGEHPSGGLFYISDSSEEVMLSSMRWRIPVFLTLGIALTAWGTARAAEVVEKSRLLWYLINNLF